MSGGFELQPRDGGPRVALAPGETLIGRGPLLGITDKRISRRHAILEVVGDQLRIKPIHTNPCFYQSSEESQLLPLKTNQWHCLNPGDSFSLLVDKYIFRVFSTHSEMEMECTLRNSQMLDEDNMLNEALKSPVTDLPDNTIGTSQLERNTELAKTQTSTTNSVSFLGECKDFSKKQSNPAQRKRILPAWMLAETLSDQNLSTPAIIGDNNVIQGCRKEGICKDKAQVNITQQGRKRIISSGNLESVSAEQDGEKKCKNADQEESVISSKEMSESFSATTLSSTDINTLKTNTQRHEIPIEELGKVSEHKIMTKETLNKEDKAVSCSESYSSVQGNPFCNESQGSHPESTSDPFRPETSHAKISDSVPGSSEENKVKRTSCMYGANCYRKNPVHFQHFSHPGDSDYGDVQDRNQDETGDRPECPYGAFCYRKNPQHKIEYRHSTLPAASWLCLCPVCVLILESRLKDQPVCASCSCGKGKMTMAEPQKDSKSICFHSCFFGQLSGGWDTQWRLRIPGRVNEDNDDIGQPNESDLNDSFLDDEEEEYEPTDEDSDWEPGKEDEEKEDMEELLKEAKKFMKRKK